MAMALLSSGKSGLATLFRHGDGSRIPGAAGQSSRSRDNALSSVLAQRRALVEGDVIGLVALDLVLRLVFRRAARVALVESVTGVDLDDPPRNVAGFGVPADAIAFLEFRGHASSS